MYYNVQNILPSSRGLGSASAVPYPSPFFDLAHTYLPQTVKELFQWCRYYYVTNSVIHAIITKKAVYPLTAIDIEEENEELRDFWKSVLKTIKFRQKQVELGLDYEAFGNGFALLRFPFTKMLQCKRCGHTEHIDSADYKFRGFQFRIVCKHCGYSDSAEVKDVWIQSPQNIQLERLNPEYINITGDPPIYTYSLPPSVVNDVTVGRHEVLSRTPQLLIEAVKEGKQIILSPKRLYHMRCPSISTDYPGWGISQLMAVLKDAYLCQLLKRATEAIMVEHIIPLRILFPSSQNPNVTVSNTISASNWKENFNSEINKWRTDPNHIPVVPFPIGLTMVGGQGRALMPIAELQQLYELLTVGMSVPRELVFGGLSFSGSSVSLRMLENDFLRYIDQQQDLADWVVNNIADYLNIVPVKTSHKEFKMADDLNRLAMNMQLRQAGDLSRHTLLTAAGHDPQTEDELIKKADDDRQNEMKKQAITQAEAQGESSLIVARYQAKAQVAMEKEQSRLAAEASIGGPPLQPSPAMAMAPTTNVGVDPRSMVSQILSKIKESPEEGSDILRQLQVQAPDMYKEVTRRLNPQQPIRALPEQKPPRRGPGTALI